MLKSYTAGFKLSVVSFADEEINEQTNKPNGTAEASRRFGVPENMIRKWRKLVPELSAASRSNRKIKPRKGKHPELEQAVKRWVLSRQDKKLRVCLYCELYL